VKKMNFNLNLSDIIKAPLKIIVGVTIAFGIILFAPDIVVKRLYMVSLRDKYGFIIAIVFLCFLSITIVGLSTLLWDKSREILLNKKALNNAKKNLKKIDNYKAAIIYSLYKEDNHTAELPLNNGAVRWLEHLMIIGKVTNQVFTMDFENLRFPYMLQPWVITELDINRELMMRFEDAYYKNEKAGFGRFKRL
jgi:putative phage membrane protein